MVAVPSRGGTFKSNPARRAAASAGNSTMVPMFDLSWPPGFPPRIGGARSLRVSMVNGLLTAAG